MSKSPEQKLHDELVEVCEERLQDLVLSWRMDGRIDPFAISWPQGPVEGDDGTIITDIVLCLLSADTELHEKELKELATKTKPCALMTCRQLPGKLLVIFESPLGTTSWTYPIRKFGLEVSLGGRSKLENTDYIGILWRPDQASAVAAGAS